MFVVLTLLILSILLLRHPRAVKKQYSATEEHFI